jgi:hypothetical protein
MSSFIIQLESFHPVGRILCELFTNHQFSSRRRFVVVFLQVSAVGNHIGPGESLWSEVMFNHPGRELLRIDPVHAPRRGSQLAQ